MQCLAAKIAPELRLPMFQSFSAESFMKVSKRKKEMKERKEEMKGDPTLAPTRPLGEGGETRAPQERPRAAKSGPRAAKSGPRAAKSGPREAKSGPREAKSTPRAAKSEHVDFGFGGPPTTGQPPTSERPRPVDGGLGGIVGFV